MKLQLQCFFLFIAQAAAVQLQLEMSNSGGGLILGGIGSFLAIVACCVCIRKFCGAFCTKCRCRRACSCFGPCMICCGCDDYPNFRLRVMAHHIKESLKHRHHGDAIQLRVQHDTRIYRTQWSHETLGNWEEMLQIYVEQGVKFLFFEVWAKSVLGAERILGECCVDVQKDIINTNYPGRIWIQLRRQGHRAALLRVSFFRDGSTNDVLHNRIEDADTGLVEEKALEQNIPFEITEKMHFEVSKAAQQPNIKLPHYLPVQTLEDSTTNYGNELRALNALSQITQGFCRTPRGIRIVSGNRFFALVHDNSKHPLQGWSLNRYYDQEHMLKNAKPEHKYDVASILSVEKTSSYLIIKHQAHHYAYDEILYLTPKDRDLDLWYQGLCLFMIKIEALTEHFEKTQESFCLGGDEPYEDELVPHGFSNEDVNIDICEDKPQQNNFSPSGIPGHPDAGAGADGAAGSHNASRQPTAVPPAQDPPVAEASGRSWCHESETRKLL